MSEGVFITVEGIDGAGKTLAVEAIAEEFDAMVTNEPSELWTGKQVRRALQEETPAFTDFFLFMADRHYHIEEIIKPNVEQGEIVVSDRYSDSTRAYQPVQLQDHIDAPTLWIEKVMSPWSYVPDLTIYLDVSVETGLERCDQVEKYENREMLEQVKDNYETWIGRQGPKDRFVIIDAEQGKDEVRREVVDVVREKLDD